MKYLSFFVLFLFLNTFLYGQVSHSITIKRDDIYLRFFTPQQNEVFPAQKRPRYLRTFNGITNFWPSFSYRIKKKEFGLELNCGSPDLCYYCYDFGFFSDPSQIGNNQLEAIYSKNINLTAFYVIIDNAIVQLDGGLGITYSEYTQSVHLGFYAGTNEPVSSAGWDNVLGPTANLNLKIPIWKGFFVSSNMRGSYFPTGKFHKGHIITEAGLGFTYSRKKKK